MTIFKEENADIQLEVAPSYYYNLELESANASMEPSYGIKVLNNADQLLIDQAKWCAVKEDVTPLNVFITSVSLGSDYATKGEVDPRIQKLLDAEAAKPKFLTKESAKSFKGLPALFWVEVDIRSDMILDASGEPAIVASGSVAITKNADQDFLADLYDILEDNENKLSLTGSVLIVRNANKEKQTFSMKEGFSFDDL